ncbi:hypothetical protein [Ovoidimarina sediminis]|uniref:hypothetical protein n=1 Tax=Ovoidimarina sediminis TaxID=3079856 RepID=UPI00290E6344|nr:hypothetical protein [Rhodophyticola sp. MJ-SS7]MDU8945695.1 hypothetical protein [Rhodophyticola sp. MJ-SS7]
MEIKGRDPATECYRVVVDVDGTPVAALVPERLAAERLTLGSRPSHEAAYTWIAANKDQIERTITRMAQGPARIRAPFDQIMLVEEH